MRYRFLLAALCTLASPALAQPADLSAVNVTATGSTTARSLAVRAADVMNVKDYGAVCDGSTDDHTALQSTFTAAVALLNAGHTAAEVFVPPGTCNSSTALTATVPTGATIAVIGHGSGVSALNFTGTTNGVALTGTATGSSTVLGSGFNVSGLSFIQSGTGIANTGLSIVTNAGANGAVTNGQRVSDVVFRGAARVTQGWAIGLAATGFQSLHITDLMAFLPDGHGNNLNGIGVSLFGVDTSHYATDAHLENITVQGGHAGIQIAGAVQGVYITNPALFGLDFGITWPGNIGDGAEDLKVTGGHINSHWRGIYMNNMSEPIITGILFIRFNPAGTDTDSPPAGPTWSAIDSENTNNAAFTGNIVYGCNCATNGTTENGFTIGSTNVTGAQPSTANSNSIAAIHNTGIAMIGTVVNLTATGNGFNGVTATYNVTPPAAWAISTVYAANSATLANGNVYTTVAGGTSAGTGAGPATTTPTNPDGTVTWVYVGPDPSSNVNATVLNSTNGSPEMSSDGVGNLHVNVTNFFTNTLQPNGQRTQFLGSSTHIWSQVWAAQYVMNNGAISANFTIDNGGNVSLGTAPSFTIKPGILVVGFTPVTISGCSNSTILGNGTTGSFHSGTSGTCTVTITMNGATGATAAHGWYCSAQDLTTPADTLLMTSSTATTCTISGTTVSGDVILFHADDY